MTKLQVVPERAVVDYSRTAFMHIVGGIRVTGTWLVCDNREAVMSLTHAGREFSHPDCISCLIRQRDAWLWTREVGDPRHCAQTCFTWVAIGALPGNPENPKDLHRVLDAVQSRLSDLIYMPPAPIRRREIAGDITFTNRTTGAVRQADIHDDV